MKYYKQLLTLVFFVICHGALAQIRQGLFLTFEDFKTNDPVAEDRIVTNSSGTGNFYYDLLKDDSINIRSANSSYPVKTATIWGYFDGKSLYLNVKKFPAFLLEGKDVSDHLWAPAVEIGKICLIHYDENFNPATGTINPAMGASQPALILMDATDGSLHAANVDNLEDLIQDDPKVRTAFNNYGGDNEGRLNTFLKAYNERHKLELP